MGRGTGAAKDKAVKPDRDLFLDEPQRVLKLLRQPIEDHIVTISRASGSLTFPANFQLIAAMNPCPCAF